MVVGRVGQLWRYPVKSLVGEQVARVVVAGGGVVGDRGWAVRDVATDTVLSAKREPRLLALAARAVGEGVVVALPAGPPAAGSRADALLSGWLGRAVRLERAGGGGYVDEADLHLLAAGELGDWDVRRFRPNVVVDGPADLDDLVGERLRLGSVVVEVDKRTTRCAMPTMAQHTVSGPAVGKDVGVLRALARGHDLRLGVYARVVSTGRLDVGAPITVA